MNIQIRKAERTQRKLKLAIHGMSGSGKTWSALAIAEGIKNGGRILLIDSENGSSTMYADKFDFDVADLKTTSAEEYIEAVNYAVKEGYDVLVIDSLSHCWEWLLEEQTRVQERSQGRLNSYTAWSKITPIYNRLIRAIVTAPIHIVATMRAKSDYMMEQSEEGGKTKMKGVKKVGLAPVFRQGGEYEFDVVGQLTDEHKMIIEKTRIDFLADKLIDKPDQKLGKKIKEWILAAKPAPKVEYTLKTKATIDGQSLQGVPFSKMTDAQIIKLAQGADKLHDDDKIELDSYMREREETSIAGEM